METDNIVSDVAVVETPIPLDQNPAAVYLASLNTESGRRTMRQALDTIAGILTGTPDALTCNWSAVRIQHTIAIRTALVAHYKAATVNKMLSALRGVLKAAWLLGYTSAEDYQKAITIPSVRNQTLPAGREVQSSEIAALLAVCREDESPSGIRDHALIAVLYGTGLRRAEVVRLDLADYSADQLIIRGKGGKERIAWLNQSIAASMSTWISVRGAWSGALFCPINKSDRLMHRRLTTQAIYYILQKRADEAEIQAFSPHDLRRTFVSNLLDAGVDISTVSRMAGHANVQTTVRYDRRAEDAKRRAADTLQLPGE